MEGELGIYVRTALGVDVICEDADVARAALGVQEVGEEALECLRVESGRPRLGLDMDGDTIPQEAGINERAVSFTKGCYVGQETVARLHYKGKPNRHLRGLRLGETGRARRRDPARRARGGPYRRRRASRRDSARSPWRSFAARRGPATRCWSAGVPGTVVDLPFSGA